MLSVLIGTEHSYPALLLAEQLADQRFVHPGPLVLGTTLLKFQRPHQIWTNLSHACFSRITPCIGLDLRLRESVNVQSLRALSSFEKDPTASPFRADATVELGRRDAVAGHYPSSAGGVPCPSCLTLTGSCPASLLDDFHALPFRNYQTSLGIVLIIQVCLP